MDYHPTTSYPPKDIAKHNTNVVTFIEVIPKKNTIINGADINAAIGSSSKTSAQSKT